MRWRTSAVDVGFVAGAAAGRRTGMTTESDGAADSEGAVAVSSRAIPKLAVRFALTCARVVSASRATKAPIKVSADAARRSNRFMKLFTWAAKIRFDRRGNVTANSQIGKGRF